MATEQEFHAHRGHLAKRSNGRYCILDDDTAPHISQYDDEAWTLDVYHERHAKQLVAMGCKALPSTHSTGKLFAVDTRQLIQFLADSEGIAIEFRKRKKRQLSDEQKAELTERMRRINAQRNGVVI